MPPALHAMIELHSAGFVLRPFINTDASAFSVAVRESVASVGRWMGWGHADFSEDDALQWFAACAASRDSGSSHEFGIFRGELLVGGAGLNHLNTRHGFCNLGYWVRASAQQQGAASAAVAALLPYAFGELKQTRVEIVVAEGNTPSMAVARKAGAVHECLARNRLLLHGVAVPAHVFSLVPEDLRTDPSAPRQLPSA